MQTIHIVKVAVHYTVGRTIRIHHSIKVCHIFSICLVQSLVRETVKKTKTDGGIQVRVDNEKEKKTTKNCPVNPIRVLEN